MSDIQSTAASINPAHAPLTPDQFAAAARASEQIGAIMQALWHMRTPAGVPDFRGRLSAARHIAGRTRLMDPSAINLEDVTDEGIRRHIALVMSIERQLEQSRAGPEIDRADGDTARASLAAGAIENGYRFEGGDPANPRNWRYIG